MFIKPRHRGVSTIVSAQKLRLPLISPCIRVNVTCVLILRLRSNHDLKNVFFEEYSALVPVDVLHRMYTEAVSEPFGFLYLNALAKDIDHMFYSGFTWRFIPSEMM